VSGIIRKEHEINNMELGETASIDDYIAITKVPRGWIYKIYNVSGKLINSHFMPDVVNADVRITEGV